MADRDTYRYTLGGPGDGIAGARQTAGDNGFAHRDGAGPDGPCLVGGLLRLPRHWRCRTDADYHVDPIGRLLEIECDPSMLLDEASNDGCLLEACDGFVRPSDPAQRDRWRAALADAMRTRRTVLVRLGTGGSRPIVALVPAADGGGLTVRSQRSAPMDSESRRAVSRLLRLSPREGEVLGLLARGMAPSAIARQLGTHLSTVRTQARSLREKGGTPRVNELLQWLACLPSLRPSVRIAVDRSAHAQRTVS